MSNDDTSSTSGSTGTGLKKCSPSTRWGRLVAMASFMMGMDEVFDASSASGASTTLSSSPKTSTLTASASTTASITSWHSASVSTSVLKDMPSTRRSASSSVIFPALAARFRDCSIRRRPRLSASSSSSATLTVSPARAHTSAMPEPMSPHPSTPTRCISSVSMSRPLLSMSKQF